MKSNVLFLASFFFSMLLLAQDEFPLQKDIMSIDGIMKAYYEVVSGPAGAPRQIARDRSLHHPDALIVITGKNEQGDIYAKTMTFDEFHSNTDSYANGFFEWESDRRVERFGNIAHVWSTYEWSTRENGPVEGRGINSIQLTHDGERWWILSWMYDSERTDNPIPTAYSLKTNGSVAPDWFRKDIEEHIGVWMADNKAYFSDEEPFDKYILEWTWGINKSYLNGKLYGEQNGQKSDVFWEYKYYWDPMNQEVSLYQIGVNGIIGKGTVKTISPGVTESTQSFVGPGMPGWRVKHNEQIIQDTMYSTSYNLTKEVAVPDRNYIWVRQ